MIRLERIVYKKKKKKNPERIRPGEHVNEIRMRRKSIREWGRVEKMNENCKILYTYFIIFILINY